MGIFVVWLNVFNIEKEGVPKPGRCGSPLERGGGGVLTRMPEFILILIG
jgi:hypothetical protein